MMDQKFCQSCAMPLEPASYGSNADGSANEEYCKYCYENGAFTKEETMEEMIEGCVPFTLEAGTYKTEEEARAAMMEYFPKLKRWAK